MDNCCWILNGYPKQFWFMATKIFAIRWVYANTIKDGLLDMVIYS